MTSYPADESIALFSWSQATTGPTLGSHTDQTWIVGDQAACLSFRDPLHAPQELVPQWRRRGKHEAYPSQCLTVAKGPDEGCYIVSKASGSPLPQLPPQRDWKNRIRINYRLGPHDPLLYPQFWTDEAPHLAWIERVEPHTQLYNGNIIGYVLQPYDWEQTYEGSPYGKLRPAVLGRLREAFMSIHLLCIPLLGQVCTKATLRRPNSVVSECTTLLSDLEVLTSNFRGTATCVTTIQRGIAELRAFRLFRLDVMHHMSDKAYVSNRMYDMIGVFTWAGTLYDLLYRLGIPVWLVSQGLPDGIPETSVVSAMPWEGRVEDTPLDFVSYSVDERGRKLRSRFDISPPRYGPQGGKKPSEEEIRAIPNRPDANSRGRSSSPRRRHGGNSGKARPSQRGIPEPTRGSQRVGGTSRSSGAGGKHRDPRAPKEWVRRTWITDPGFQASGGEELPGWLPAIPAWLRDVGASVDRSVEREWRLCSPDLRDAVPQWVFDENQTHAMPPFHLFAKNENRLKHTFPFWAAFRDFWLWRIIRGETKGLDATTWRKVIDGKHRIAPSLEEWLNERAKTSAAAMHRTAATPTAPNADSRDATNADARDAMSESADVAARRERLQMLRKQLNAVLESKMLEREGTGEDAVEDPGELIAEDVEDELAHGGPEPDPVYGLHDPPKLHDIEEFVVRGKRLTKDDLGDPGVRAFLVWEVQEATFRFQVRQVDTHVLKSRGIWTSKTAAERRALWPQVWGGQDGFVPSGNISPALTDEDPRKRLSCVYHFWKLVSVWPRYHEIPNLRNYTLHGGLQLTELRNVEEAIWNFYAQTFFDYFGFMPTIPTCMPRNPFVE